MGAIYNKETETYEWISPHKSWMECPKNLTEKQVSYLTILEQLFTVENAGGERVPYLMSPHQVWFHLYDYALSVENSIIKVIIKSRNTSFTVSSIINLIMNSISIKSSIVPLVRLNAKRSTALVSEFNDMIKHMNTIETDDGVMPFNSKDCKMGAAQSLELPNGNQFVAFPANSDSSESIRGIRTHFGFNDESNFMRKFVDIFTANRKASYGVDEKGIEHFQMLVGTTLKGETYFSKWYEKLLGRSKVLETNKYIKVIDNYVIFDWPIFERSVFEKYYKGEPELEIPFQDNKELISLVTWQSKEKLWNEYKQDSHIFMEESMATKVDGDDQFYNMMLILNSIKENLAIDIEDWEEKLHTLFSHVQIGIDVASVNDYFVIDCFGKTFEGIYKNFKLVYKNKVDLPVMEVECQEIMRKLNECGISWACGVDANGIGLHLTQNLQREFGDEKIRGIKGGYVKDSDGNSHKLNEYGHTILKRMMLEGSIELINDEKLIEHFAGFNYNYKCKSSGNGHGDITMATLYAMLHDDTGNISEGRLHSSSAAKDSLNDKNVWYMKEFKKRVKGFGGRRYG